MLEKLANIFRIPELRNRVLFTLALLAVYRLGSHIPTPGIDAEVLANLFATQRGSLLGLGDLFTGGNLSRMTIFALGIMPYISASIIMQLMSMVSKQVEELRKEGDAGRRKLEQYTRYGTLILSTFQSFGVAMYLEGLNDADVGGGRFADVVGEPGWGFRLMTVLTLTTGSMFVMWLGEQITERGIGNGMSLIIFAGIVVGLPQAVMATLEQLRTGQMTLFAMWFARRPAPPAAATRSISVSTAAPSAPASFSATPPPSHFCRNTATARPRRCLCCSGRSIPRCGSATRASP